MSDNDENETGTPEEEFPVDLEKVQDQSLASVLPLHAATGTGGMVRRGRGRPKKINPKPSSDDLVYHAETMRRKTAFINADSLVQAAASRQEAMETLQRVKEEVAKEAASLLFARNEEEKYGKDTTQISSRRIAALREIAGIELEIKKLGITMIDLKGERFQKIFAFLLEGIREAASEVLSPEQLDLLFNRMETKLEGWEEKAQVL